MTFGLRLGLKEETMHMKIIGQRAQSKGKSSKAAKVEISLVFSKNLQCLAWSEQKQGEGKREISNKTGEGGSDHAM